jgi:hypothetical protein
MINVTNGHCDAHKKISQRENHRRDYWETHGEDTRHG